MTDLKEMTDFLYGEGEPMQGGTFTVEEAKVQGKAFAKFKPYRVVRDWIWAEVDVDEKIVKANWVRTTPLTKFTPPCFFETRNTVYILVGEGKRKTTSMNAIMSIF